MRKKKVLVYGNFNILHPGHLRFLKFAKKCGDELIVGVMSDEIGKEAIFVNQKFRVEALKQNNYVDKVTLVKTSIEKLIKKIKPNIVVKGKEYESILNPEEKVIKKNGGSLIFSSGETTFSSTDLIDKELNQRVTKKFTIKKGYLKRYKIDLKKIEKGIKNFSKLKVLVIGDLIVDEYIFSEAIGMSREEPSIVLKPQKSKKFLGGAGIVAAHAANLNAKTYFISVVNNDHSGNFAKKELEKNHVKTFLYLDKNRPTTLKKKYKANNKTIFRINELSQSIISIKLQNKIFKKIKELKNKVDLIVFSDFNYGILTQQLIKRTCDLFKGSNVIITADSQSSSQIGDVTKFKKINLLTPTEYEARVGIKNNDDGLAVIASNLEKTTGIKKILIKLGEDGIFIHEKSNKVVKYDILPTLNNNPKDVAGAGDSFLIASSLSLALKFNIWEISLIGSLSAAIQISKIGNIPINNKELLSNLKVI